MQKLKQILSPRIIVMVLTIAIFAYSLTVVDRPSQSQTQGIVTVMAVDMADDKIQLACSIITPTGQTSAKSSVYSTEADSMGEAVELLGMQLGKDLGFAQCDVIAVGPKIVEKGVIRALDYFTRTKKVGKNVLLVNFDGKTDEFIKSSVYLQESLSLKLSQILMFNKEFMLAVDSNLENFYLGYYADSGISIVPKIMLTKEENPDGIEIQLTQMQSSTATSASSQSSGESSSGQSQDEKLFFVNDGTTTVLKNGKKLVDIIPDDIAKINLFIQNSKYGVYKVEGITDDIYNDASVIMELESKNSDVRYHFKNGKPIVKLDLTMYLQVEEVIENSKNENLLVREDKLVTKAVVEKLREDLNKDLEFCVNFMKEKNIDLLGIEGWFNKFHYKKWQKYKSKEENKENVLKNIEFEWKIDIAQYL